MTRAGAVLAAERQALRHGHAEALLPMVARVMTAARLRPGEVDFVAVATGPGGFTGIRVGLAAAHGIALAAGARLIGIDSFAATAAALADGDQHPLLVALDSRREDLYVQLFAPDRRTPLAPPQALLPERLAEHAVRLVGGATPLLLAGDAAEAAAAALGGGRAVIAPGSAPDAIGVAAAAQHRLRTDTAVAQARPLYLRPPDVTAPNRSPRPVEKASS